MLMVQTNPFLIEGYLSPDFFCDRIEETALLTRHLTNRCNVALIAPRRLGKSGLIYHCFYQKEIREQYHCIYIDIYDTKNLGEFVYALGKGILAALKPKGRKVWEFFLNMLQSLKSTISFDINGNPEWSVGIGDIQSPDITLDEIFAYLSQADKPCLIAIDEFQTIAGYPEKTVEATLRKRIQNCHNANFIFSGSKRHMMALMFTSRSCPFYHSSSIMGLEAINEQTYLEFANHHLSKINKQISDSKVLGKEDVEYCIESILSQHRFAYQALLFQLTSKQKQLLIAIAREGSPSSLMSQEFLHKYRLGASTVQGAVKTLLERDFITQDEGVYQLCDKFLKLSLKEEI